MIHCYKFDDKNIVLDVYSGSIHMVDDVAYEIIQMYETHTRDEIVKKICPRFSVTEQDVDECLEDIESLKEAGKLYAPDKYESIAIDLKKRRWFLKALCLHVAHTCNLSCSYCFAAQGKFHGKQGLMSFETGKRAIDFLIENSGYHKNLDIDFFGGEPLMNWDVVKKLVEYGRSVEKAAGKNIRFTLTTNGVNIDDDVIEFCNKEMHNVVLSLDGRKEVNDRFRVDYKGNGSYDVIVPKFKKFVEARGNKSYYMRGTYTHFNTDFLNDIKHMADLGFKELSMEPVVTSPDSPSYLTEEDLPVLMEQYEELAREMIRRNSEGNGFTFYHYMLDLTCGPCIYKRISGCGAGTEYVAVTPWGDLYPCHQFVGDEKWKLGDIFEGFSDEGRNVSHEFAQVNCYTREGCKDCWAKLYCSGGCAANAYHAGGDIKEIYDYGCRLFRKRIECALAVRLSNISEEDIYVPDADS
ncbi:MAG: thioether cross-link-forming SCIFF peptide maturase [Clostridiales bacterium]|nr:thioether cross-link-forming SCIFF peptide maturase [Clostridiales bacterium]